MCASLLKRTGLSKDFYPERIVYRPTYSNGIPKVPFILDYLDISSQSLVHEQPFDLENPEFCCHLMRRPISWMRAEPTGLRGKMRDAQRMTKIWYRSEWKSKGAKIVSSPVVLFMEFAYIPTGRSQKARESKLGTLKDSVPDLDNLIKFVKDAGKGVLFEDDRHVAAVHACKIYRPYEGTTIWMYRAQDLIKEIDVTNRRSKNNRELEDEEPPVDGRSAPPFMSDDDRFLREFRNGAHL